jgi:NitT/TauT family transport system substrate-binding protein
VRVSCSDVVSPSYFVATAAVDLGFFKEEGVDVEFVYSTPSASQAVKDGELAFYGCSPYIGLMDFPGWTGGKVLCALSQKTYWFLGMRADLNAKKGDVNAVKGRRLSASGAPGMLLRQLLLEAGIDFEQDNTQIVPAPPADPDGNMARLGAIAIERGIADGFWGNAMRAEYAVRRGLATVLLDVRRGDGPPAAREWTFASLVTSERLVRENPEAAAGAVRAIVKTQKALSADPSLATQVGRRMFPPEEAELIAELIDRDVPFFDPHITEDMIQNTAQFARDIGVLTGDVKYEDVVATEFRDLWDA